MAQILDGKKVATILKSQLKDEIEKLNQDISLTIFQVGDNPASNIYIHNKEKACAEVGIKSYVVKYDETQSELDISTKMIWHIENTGGAAMLQLPLPSQYDEHFLTNIIPVHKDADCLTTTKLGELCIGTSEISPCTAQGIIDLLDYYQIPIEGKNAVIIGRSNIVGKPIAHLLLQRNATVTICHSKTKNLSDITNKADILIVAIGKPKFVTVDMVKEHSVIIDVGINRDENNKLCGDVDFENVKSKVDWITPVPNGVGAMTVVELLKNTVELCKKYNI